MKNEECEADEGFARTNEELAMRCVPRSFVAKAPLDDNKGEKEKTLWNSVYSVVKENLW